MLKKLLSHSHCNVFVMLGLFFVTFTTLLIDSVGSNTSIVNYTGISSTQILQASMIIAFLMRLKNNPVLFKKQFRIIVFTLCILISSWTVIHTIWEYMSPLNHVYSITRMHSQQLGLLSLFLGYMALLTLSNSFWKKHIHSVICISPVVGLLTLSVAWFWPMNYFLEIVKEDQIIEYLQVFVLLFGVATLIYHLIHHYRTYEKIDLIIMMLITLTLFLFAGDEISWGQRILGIESPEHIADINRQNELTIHNLYSVEWLVEKGYLFIGLTGGLLWLIKDRLVTHIQWLRWFVPSRTHMLFFLITGVYFAYPYYWGANRLREWSEVIELVFYSGIVTHVIEETVKTRPAKTS